ncbi:hypothetical protein NMY22_g19997 [Coprinellus aureogranulatus]|nr:hypothetical protein NMY22_g19997 [Coprinellus aureogranulatus]
MWLVSSSTSNTANTNTNTNTNATTEKNIRVALLPASTSIHPSLHPSPSPSIESRPPLFGALTTRELRKDELVARYASVITPSSSYVGDALNGYAGMGVPKPFVHLVPPLRRARRKAGRGGGERGEGNEVGDGGGNWGYGGEGDNGEEGEEDEEEEEEGTVKYIQKIPSVQGAVSAALLALGDGNWKMGEGVQVGAVGKRQGGAAYDEGMGGEDEGREVLEHYIHDVISTTITSLTTIAKTSRRPAFGAIFLLNNITYLRVHLSSTPFSLSSASPPSIPLKQTHYRPPAE